MNTITRIKKSLIYRWPRIKYRLFYWPLGSVFYHFWNRPHVYSLEETLEKMVNDKLSICRFGNAEFDLIFGEDQEYQRYDNVLGDRLKDILNTNKSNIIVGIPDVFDDLDKFEPFTKRWWKEYMITYSYKYRNLFKKSHYYNAFISRTATDYLEDQTWKIIPGFKKMWDNRDLLIVEGKNTRIGIGNDLLSNTKSIKRILVPNRSAFSFYEDIMSAIRANLTGNELIILAAGPTATLLAYDLAQLGYQALDLGHFDIQYEHHIRGYKGKHAIPGKHFNEVAQTDNSIDKETERLYRTQIVYTCVGE